MLNTREALWNPIFPTLVRSIIMNANMFRILLAANLGIFPIRDVAYCTLGIMICIMGYFIITPIMRREPPKMWLPFAIKLMMYVLATALIIWMAQ